MVVMELQGRREKWENGGIVHLLDEQPAKSIGEEELFCIHKLSGQCWPKAR